MKIHYILFSAFLLLGLNSCRESFIDGDIPNDIDLGEGSDIFYYTYLSAHFSILVDSGNGNQLTIGTEGVLSSQPYHDTYVCIGNADPYGNDRVLYVGSTTSHSTRIILHEKDLAYASLSPDGSTILFATTELNGGFFHGHQLYTISTDGSNRKRIADDVSPLVRATISPDGLRVAFVASKDQGGKRSPDSVYVMSIYGGKKTVVAGSVCRNVYGASPSLTWTKDGTKILAVLSDNAYGSDLYLINTDGVGTPMKITNNFSQKFDAVISPDGKTAVYLASSGGGASGFDLYSVATTGNASPAKITETEYEMEMYPQFSVDGKRLLYGNIRIDNPNDTSQYNDQNNQINVLDLETGTVEIVASGWYKAFWKK